MNLHVHDPQTRQTIVRLLSSMAGAKCTCSTSPTHPNRASSITAAWNTPDTIEVARASLA